VIVDRLASLEAVRVLQQPPARQVPRGRDLWVEVTLEKFAGADLTLVVTDHDDFDLGAIARHASWVLDTRHRLPPAGHV
jgi:UDP-N-acetyl-D-glucosamine dehydrogenase